MGYCLLIIWIRRAALCDILKRHLELHPGDDPKLDTRQDMEDLIDSVQEGYFSAAVLGVLPGADRELVGNLCRDGSRIAPDDG